MPEALPRVFRPRTVRVQLTLAITAVVALIVALAGLAVVLYADHRDRAEVDRALTRHVATVRTAAAKSGTLPTDGTYAVRLLDGTTVRTEVGATTQFSIPVDDGYSTVTAADGSHWRSWAETLKTGAQLQVLVSLAKVEKRHSGNVGMIDLIVIVAALVAAAGTWFVGGLVLKPLIERVEMAENTAAQAPPVASPPQITATDEIPVVPHAEAQAVPAPAPEPEPVAAGDRRAGGERRAGAREATMAGTAELAERIAEQAAGEFAKETVDQLRAPLAELGQGLDQLLDNPEMPATMRHLYLASVQSEYRRLVTLVDDLDIKDLP